MIVDGLASMPHYRAHVQPIFDALPDGVRGEFHGTGAMEQYHRPPGQRWPLDHLVMVAGWVDYRRSFPRPVVLIDHGAGQTYLDLPDPSYAGSAGWDRVRLFVSPSERVADLWQARYPDVPAVAMGCPKLDPWLSGARSWHPNLERPVVAVTFHSPHPGALCPEAGSAWNHYEPGLEMFVKEATIRGWRVLGHAHPRWNSRPARSWRAWGAEWTNDAEEVFDRASMLAFDNTSLGWEACALDIPVVLMDCPAYRPDVHHGLRFYDAAGAGLRVSGPEGLVDAVSATLESDPCAQERRRVANAVYAHRDGRSALRAAEAVLGVL